MDAVFERGWRRLVSVPSPASDYFRRLPAWVTAQAPAARCAVVLFARTGTFAGHVARGAVEAARLAGFELVRPIAFDSASGRVIPRRHRGGVLARGPSAADGFRALSA